MASISTGRSGKRKGHHRILFELAGKRKTLYLGRMSLRAVKAIQCRVEQLVASSITGHAVDGETARWIANLDRSLAAKLAKVGLIESRKTSRQTLGGFIAEYKASRVELESSTLATYKNAENNLYEKLGQDRRLDSVTAGDAKAFASWLKTKLAPSTVSRRLRIAKQFFAAAVDHEIIVVNPFAKVSTPFIVDEDRQKEVAVVDVQRLLEVCSPEWRTIIALARFGGLRCPSEVLTLRWENVDLLRGRMTVTSPKTKHIGKQSRQCPIFHMLRPYLEEALELAKPGAIFVVAGEHKGASEKNLRTQLHRLCDRAGVPRWPKFFNNARATLITELATQYPMQSVCKWVGNTIKVAAEHYLLARDEEFLQASQMPECDAPGNARQRKNATLTDVSTSRQKTQIEPPTDDNDSLYAENPGGFLIAPSGPEGTRTPDQSVMSALL